MTDEADIGGGPLSRCMDRLLDVEDLRRRGEAHAEWLRRNPAAVAVAEAWADDALDELTTRSA